MQRVILLKNKTAERDKYELEFQSNGLEPVFLPLISHEHVPQELFELLRDDSYLKNLQEVIVTSQRAVECLYKSVLPTLNETARRDFLLKTVYAVGPGTEDFLTGIGFQNVKGGEKAGNGDILSDIIISDHQKNGRDTEPLLLVGEIRKDTIPRKLSCSGILTKEVVIYKTKDLPDNLSRFKDCVSRGCWVVFFSPQGTEEIIEFIKNGYSNGLVNQRVASIGPTTMRFLRTRGLEPNTMSNKPNERDLVNAILST